MIAAVVAIRRPALRVVAGPLLAVVSWRLLAVRSGENPPWYDDISVLEEYACSISIPVQSLRVLNVRPTNTHEMN